MNFLIVFFFQSISYNNVVIRKETYFSHTFLKSWIHIHDNIAGVVGNPQYYYRDYRYGEGKENLFPCPIII